MQRGPDYKYEPLPIITYTNNHSQLLLFFFLVETPMVISSKLFPLLLLFSLGKIPSNLSKTLLVLPNQLVFFFFFFLGSNNLTFSSNCRFCSFSNRVYLQQSMHLHSLAWYSLREWTDPGGWWVLLETGAVSPAHSPTRLVRAVLG
jgi:hypothetical protein